MGERDAPATLDFDLAFEDEVGGAGQRDVLVGVAVPLEVDVEVIATGDANFDWWWGVGELVVDDGAGDHAGATGEGLVFYPALVGADSEAAGGEDFDEVGVGPCRGEKLVVAH